MTKRNVKNAKSSVATTSKARQRQSRRRLIQTLALGGGIASSKLVPSSWTAPIVKTALLPAHATGSRCSMANHEAFPLIVNADAGPGESDLIVERLADVLIPEAVAGDGDGPPSYELLGCFRIEFFCNENGGTLHALAVPFLGDNPQPMWIDTDFDFGEYGDLMGYCFRVVRSDNSAVLSINFGNCQGLQGPIILKPNISNCELGDLATDT